MICIGIWNVGLKLDIFAMDNISKEDYSDYEGLKKRIHTYIDTIKNIKDENEYIKFRLHIIGNPNDSSPYAFYCQQEFYPSYTRDFLHFYEDIFPLKRVLFENMYQFYIPKNYDKYLKTIYGNYMSFPENGILHHVEDNIPIYLNSEKYNGNLYKITQKLKNIQIID